MPVAAVATVRVGAAPAADNRGRRASRGGRGAEGGGGGGRRSSRGGRGAEGGGGGGRSGRGGRGDDSRPGRRASTSTSTSTSAAVTVGRRPPARGRADGVDGAHRSRSIRPMHIATSSSVTRGLVRRPDGSEVVTVAVRSSGALASRGRDRSTETVRAVETVEVEAAPAGLASALARVWAEAAAAAAAGLAPALAPAPAGLVPPRLLPSESPGWSRSNPSRECISAGSWMRRTKASRAAAWWNDSC